MKIIYQEDDYLMLSGIQHFEFCRRQWALIHIEQQWSENYYTTSGDLFHKRVHDGENVEKRGNTVIVRGLRISSSKLGITGQCDVVEFIRDENGISLNKYPGKWRINPVEYKRGTPKEGKEDALQLCTQAMCLEEMFLTKIDKGYLFYGENRRRSEIIFDEALREKVEKNCIEMHQLFAKGHTPKVKVTKKCKSCSLQEICVPKLQKNLSVSEYIKSNMEEE